MLFVSIVITIMVFLNFSIKKTDDIYMKVNENDLCIYIFNTILRERMKGGV